MSEITKSLYMSTWLLHLNKGASGLDYMSRIDGEPASWYLWINKVPGVYELKLKSFQETSTGEQCSFYLKYYPAEEEEVFDDYSCAEQFVRLGDLFDQEIVRISESEEICPCCGGKNENCKDRRHNFLVKRPKGIPTLARRKLLDDSLFEVGELGLVMQEGKLTNCSLKTQRLYETRPAEGIYVKDDQGVLQELVAPGAVDRKLPGYELSRRIYDFIMDKFLGSIHCGPDQETITENAGCIEVQTTLKAI